MKHIYPNYYNDFSCVASECEMTCCAGWQIEIDSVSMSRYANTPLIENVNVKENTFRQKADQRCAFLNDTGLCNMILDYGEDMICNTCREFPRHIEEFENVREHSLSIACPTAAYLVLESEVPQYISQDEDAADEEEYDEYEQAIYTELTVIRKCSLDIMGNVKDSLLKRCAAVSKLVQVYQDVVDKCAFENVDYSVEELVHNQCTYSMSEEHQEYLSVLQYKNLVNVFDTWEFSSARWRDIVNDSKNILSNMSDSKLQEMILQYKENNPKIDVYITRIICYYIYAFFCGSTYDEYYFGMMNLALASGLLIHFLAVLNQDKDIELLQIAYLYARELEHSTENVIATEKYFEENPIRFD